MFLVAKPNHLSIEERHSRHERRYRTSVSSSIGLPQEVERWLRWRAAFIGRGRAFAAGDREAAGNCDATGIVPEGQARSGPDFAYGRRNAPASDVRDRRGLRGRRRLRFSEIRSDLQDGGGPAAEDGRASVLAADDVAAGECPLEDRGRAGDGGHG